MIPLRGRFQVQTDRPFHFPHPEHYRKHSGSLESSVLGDLALLKQNMMKYCPLVVTVAASTQLPS